MAKRKYYQNNIDLSVYMDGAKFHVRIIRPSDVCPHGFAFANEFFEEENAEKHLDLIAEYLGLIEEVESKNTTI